MDSDEAHEMIEEYQNIKNDYEYEEDESFNNSNDKLELDEN